MGSTSRDSPSSDVESPASRTAACAANRSLCRAAVPSSKRRCWQELLKELRRPQLATAESHLDRIGDTRTHVDRQHEARATKSFRERPSESCSCCIPHVQFRDHGFIFTLLEEAENER